MSPLSADLQTTFSKLRAECLPLSHCTTCADLRLSPSTVIALRIPWKKVFLPKISRCLLQNPNRSPLIGGLGKDLSFYHLSFTIYTLSFSHGSFLLNRYCAHSPPPLPFPLCRPGDGIRSWATH